MKSFVVAMGLLAASVLLPALVLLTLLWMSRGERRNLAAALYPVSGSEVES